MEDKTGKEPVPRALTHPRLLLIRLDIDSQDLGDRSRRRHKTVSRAGKGSRKGCNGSATASICNRDSRVTEDCEAAAQGAIVFSRARIPIDEPGPARASVKQGNSLEDMS